MSVPNIKAKSVTQREETIADRYNRCQLLNIIQHIDIYGKLKTTYMEKCRNKYADVAIAVTSMSSTSRHFSCGKDVSSELSKDRILNPKLSKFSVTTKVSGLYPGHDILSKKARKIKLSQQEVKSLQFGAPVVVMR